METLYKEMRALASFDAFRIVFALACIVWGVFAFITPFTPASWLFFVGLTTLLGKEEARRVTQKIIGERMYARLHIDAFF